MASRLESIPYDVLLQVAFHTASGCILSPPSTLPSLLLTSKALYRGLNVRACPHLYARLFLRQFDAPTLFPKVMGEATATTLAGDYVVRQRLLRRSRLGLWSTQELLADMRCALRMVIESDGINETQLARNAFPEELLALAEAHLPDNGEDPSLELNCLLVWLLSLSLSREDIMKIPSERLERISLLLHRFAVPTPNASHSLWFSELASFFRHSVPPSPHFPSSGSSPTRGSSLALALSHPFSVLQPCFAAINVLFALKESRPIIIPPHLPETRAIALANQFTGPTRQDLHEFQSVRTPLFADSIPRNIFDASLALQGRSSSHDPQLYHLFGMETGRGEARFNLPGMFSGLWKGSMMTEVSIPQENGEAIRESMFDRRPMQVLLRSYHCFVPHTPLPTSKDDNGFNSFPFQPWDNQTDDLEQLLAQYHYVDLEASNPDNSRGASQAIPQSRIVDTILFGETTDDHDQAWKGFRYIGRIQRDGLVLLKRKPKHQAEEYLGTSLFEGRLRIGETFVVGRWRSSEVGPRGIFTLVKTTRDEA